MQLRILKITANKPEVFYDKAVSVSSFPLEIEVSGTGQVDYQVYIMANNGTDAIFQGVASVNFNEED